MDAKEPIFEFGPFRVDRSQRKLFAHGAAIPVGARALDVLHFLISHRDRVVTKDEIIAHVWQDVVVEENNLAVQISALRRALSDPDQPTQSIITVPGRGYRFVAEAAVVAEEGEADAPPTPATIPRRWRDPPWRRLAGAGTVLAAVSAGLWLLGPDTLSSIRAGLSSFRGEPAAKPAPRLSIVVMPFRNLGDDAEDGYLADAISDDLTTDLQHLPGSVVIARTSADSYKGRTVGAEQIGRELAVRYLLEGSLRRVGETISVNAQLIDTANGGHLWAERFEASRQQLPDTQRAIVRRIASALNFNLVQIEGSRSLQDRPNNPDAVDLFLRARSLRDRDDSLAGLIKAQAMLRQALDRQPDFVEALSELAWLLLTKVRNYDDPTDAEDMEMARKAISHGLELAPHNARLHAARGFLYKLDGRCEEATASYGLALSYDPNDVDARSGVALCAANLGHPEEAAIALEQVLLIDPQDPRNRSRFNQLGLVHLMSGHPDQAIGWFRKAMSGEAAADGGNEDFGRGEWNEIGMISALGLAGRLAEAQERYKLYAGLRPHRTVWHLASYFTHAESILPGFKAAMAALKAAGMPEFAEDKADESVAPRREQIFSGEFAVSPSSIPGGQLIGTADLKRRLDQNPALAVIDVGCGVAVIPGAIWLNQTFPAEEAEAQLIQAVSHATKGALDRPVVVSGCSRYGGNSYNAALALIAHGYRAVFWDRGGEEAWAAAGYPAEDRRSP